MHWLLLLPLLLLLQVQQHRAAQLGQDEEHSRAGLQHDPQATH
jgi:hypothetical protein